MLKKIRPLYALLLVAIASCTTVKTENQEKEIYAFFQHFSESLSKTEKEILQFFETRQSENAVLAVVKVLQNEDPSLRVSTAFFASNITTDPDGFVAAIPVTVSVAIDQGEAVQIFVPFHIRKNSSGQYVITRIEGEELYKTVQRLKNENDWSIKEAEELRKREAIYTVAKKLEQQYDSVIWYTTYNDQNYFYVVDSTWTNYFLHYKTLNQRNVNVKMGLCDSSGTLIIPIAYDLIGTIGFVQPELVEVTLDSKVGYFDMASRQFVIDPVYDMIIPYDTAAGWITKKDNVYGWIDGNLQYTDQLPSDSVRQWVENFNYLRKTVRLAVGMQSFCEIPDKKYAGNGIVIPPAYLVHNGLFDYIESGLVSSSAPLNGWTEYKEGKSGILEKITTEVRALIATVTERYLEGREEFYTKNKMIFLNNAMDTLSVAQFDGDNISYRSIDSTLLEVETPHGFGFDELEVAKEYYLKARHYISIADGKVTPLTSNRFFPETEFVKLDSSYLQGKFFMYDPDLGEQVETSFLSEYTITWMRNDILAAYGYAFPGTPDSEKFDTRWYTPKYNDIKEFEDALSDIDRHNLAFLEKILGLMRPVA